MITTTLQVPCVHLNGTSREALVTELRVAYQALRVAIEAHQAAAPNQRDYYPLGDAAWGRAKAEHALRCDRLRSVQVELEALAVAIQDGALQVPR